jgi:ABC-type multidrug transport system ATPase subunit
MSNTTFPSEPPVVTPYVCVRHLAKRYGRLEALRDAHFDIRHGEVLGLLGPNGAGKTTLMGCLAGLIAPDAGQLLDAQHELTADARRRLLFYLPDGIAPWGAQCADWLLPFTRDAFGAFRTTSRAASDVASDAVQRVLRIHELGAQRIDTLSKGQRKRLLLAMALQMPQPVILLDEPFDGLDVQLTRQVIALFRQVVAYGRTLVVSLHAMPDAAKVCDRLVLMNDGVSIADGTLEELRRVHNLPDAELEDVFLAFVQ